MQHIWWILKFVETAGGMISLGFHIHGILRFSEAYDHPIYSIVFACGTLATMISHLEMSLEKKPKPISEAILNLFVGCMYIFIAILTMYHCEEEYEIFFLQELSGSEIVQLLKYYKAQSLSALTTGGIHLVHSVLAFDAEMSTAQGELSDIPDEDVTPTGPIKMYVINDTIDNWLMHFEWFRNLDMRRMTSETLSDEEDNEV